MYKRQPHSRERDIFEKACRSLDYFLDEYGVDGCCDEGAQYYRHAGLTLFNALEVLNGITDHAFSSVYREEKVRNIASYILNAHVDGEYYVNFADCSPVAGRCNAREFLFGKRTENPELMAFAAADYQAGGCLLLSEEHNLFYRLQTVFNHEEMITYDSHPVIRHPDIFYPSAGLFITRDDTCLLYTSCRCCGCLCRRCCCGGLPCCRCGGLGSVTAAAAGQTCRHHGTSQCQP